MAAIHLADVPEELRRLTGAITILEHPTQGATSDVAFLGDVVLKRCADPRYLDWLRREHVVLKGLDGVDVAAAPVLGFVDSAAEVWLATRRLPGVSFASALQAADGDRRRLLLGELGALLRHVHGTKIPPALRDGTSWIERQLAQARRNLSWCDGSVELLDELSADRPLPVPATLIPGDLGLDNVLVENDRVTSLIDWPLGGAGDPRMDTAIAMQPREGFALDAAQVAAFWGGYGSPPPDSAVLSWFERLWDFF